MLNKNMSSSILKVKSKLANKFSLGNLKLPKIKKQTKITSLIGLDISHNGLRIVEISKVNDNPVVSYLGGANYEDNLEGDNLNLEKVRTIFSDFNLNSKFVNSIIKSPEVKLEFKRLPYVDTKELEKIIEVEKEKLNQQQLISDYVVLGEVKDKRGKKLLVLLVSVPKKDVYKLVALLESFSLDPFCLEIEPVVFSRLLNFNKELKEDLFYVVASLGSREVSVSLHKGPQLYLHRNFYSVGEAYIVKAIADELSIDLKHAEKIKKDIDLNKIYKTTSDTEKQILSSIDSVLKKRIIELERSIQYFANVYPAVDIEKVFLAGINTIQGMDDYISKKIKIPVEFIDPFKNLSLQNKAKTDFDKHSFSVSIGLALRGFLE